MLEFLGETISFTLQALSFALVHCSLSHARALTVAVCAGLIHFEVRVETKFKFIYIITSLPIL